MEIDTVLIGNRIRTVRNLRNMTADVLAEEIGLAEVTLRHIETGANKTSLLTLMKIADTLDVSIDYLLGRVSSPMEMKTISFREAYDLTDHQEQMLAAMIEKLIPVVKDYMEK